MSSKITFFIAGGMFIWFSLGLLSCYTQISSPVVVKKKVYREKVVIEEKDIEYDDEYEDEEYYAEDEPEIVEKSVNVYHYYDSWCCDWYPYSYQKWHHYYYDPYCCRWDPFWWDWGFSVNIHFGHHRYWHYYDPWYFPPFYHVYAPGIYYGGYYDYVPGGYYGGVYPMQSIVHQITVILNRRV